MKFYQSIRFRIIAGTLLFGLLLIIITTSTLFFVMRKGMSRMITNLISTEAEYFLYKYEIDKTSPLPHSKYIAIFKGFDELPDNMKDRIKGLPLGIHYIKPDKQRHPLHVGVIQLPDKENPYYLVFHGRAFFQENVFLRPKEILLIFLGLLLIPGGIVGYFLSRALFKPVVKLMEQIKDLDPENLQTEFSHNQAKNELGMLSKTIYTTMNRINAFIQREKQFTRDASHELRTPLTIISGAVEIMEQQPEVENNPILGKPLQRISRSVSDMQTTIETFLWLAREESGPFKACHVAPVVEKAIGDNQYIISGKNVQVDFAIQQDKSINVKEEILYIAITNLIRNAFQFTSKGSVAITLNEKCFRIQDTGKGIHKEVIHSVTKSHIKGEKSQGFGLGLSIVSRLCKRFGWELVVESEPERGTLVIIYWKRLPK